MSINKPLTPEELAKLSQQLETISPWPWKWTKTAGGEYWITAPDNSDHEYREDYEPIFESSGTIPQFAIDAEFIANAPEVIARLMGEIIFLEMFIMSQRTAE